MARDFKIMLSLNQMEQDKLDRISEIKGTENNPETLRICINGFYDKCFPAYIDGRSMSGASSAPKKVKEPAKTPEEIAYDVIATAGGSVVQNTNGQKRGVFFMLHMVEDYPLEHFKSYKSIPGFVNDPDTQQYRIIACPETMEVHAKNGFYDKFEKFLAVPYEYWEERKDLMSLEDAMEKLDRGSRSRQSADEQRKKLEDELKEILPKYGEK